MNDLGQKIKNRNLHSLVSQDVFEDQETSHLLNCDEYPRLSRGRPGFNSPSGRFFVKIIFKSIE